MVTCGRHGYYGQVLVSYSGVRKETRILLLVCLFSRSNDDDTPKGAKGALALSERNFKNWKRFSKCG